MSFYNSNFKTLFTFNTLSSTSYLPFLTVFLFSSAGVPPFIEFFSKVYLLNLLVEQDFSLLFYLFITLLIFGLYFYVQNLCFLHSTNAKSLLPYNTPVYTNEWYTHCKRSFTLFYMTIILTKSKLYYKTGS
jgi:NADH:ubiquinone oxidoreductase subunit 2 (subunit N)